MIEIPTFALLFQNFESSSLSLLFRWRALESLCVCNLTIWFSHVPLLPLPSCLQVQQRHQLSDTQGPVVQSIVSLTNLLRVISLTVLADSIYSILIFFAEKI